MDEKLELVKELMEASSSLEEFARHDKAKAAGLSYTNGELYLQFPFLSVSDAGRCGEIRDEYLVSMHDRVQ